MVGFRIPLAGFRIPKPWIPDSTDQNYLGSGFRITLHGAKGQFLLRRRDESVERSGDIKKDRAFFMSKQIS